MVSLSFCATEAVTIVGLPLLFILEEAIVVLPCMQQHHIPAPEARQECRKYLDLHCKLTQPFSSRQSFSITKPRLRWMKQIMK